MTTDTTAGRVGPGTDSLIGVIFDVLASGRGAVREQRLQIVVEVLAPIADQPGALTDGQCQEAADRIYAALEAAD